MVWSQSHVLATLPGYKFSQLFATILSFIVKDKFRDNTFESNLTRLKEVGDGREAFYCDFSLSHDTQQYLE
jgi:thioredoxin-related protein